MEDGQSMELKPLEIKETNKNSNYNYGTNKAMSDNQDNEKEANEEPKQNEKEKEAEDDEDDEDGYEFNDNVPNSNFFQDNFELEELKNRVSDLEKKLKNSLNMAKFSGIGSSGSSGEDLELVKADLGTVKNMVADHYQKTDEMQKVLDDMKVKVEDFNVADLFKDCQIEGGNLDASKILLANLENKLTKKISLLEESLKKDEKDFMKIKNDQYTLKNTQDSLQRSVNQTKEDVKQLAELMQSSIGATNDTVSDMDNKFKEMILNINKTINENEKKTKENFDKINKKLANLENDKPQISFGDLENNAGLSEADLNFLKELNLRMNSIERNIKAIQNSPEIPNLKKELEALKEEIGKRAFQQDLYDLSDKINEHSLKFSELSNDVENLIKESEKTSETINFLIKKLEHLNSQISLLKQGDEYENQGRRQNNIDLSKYLEINAFHEFIRRYENDVQRLNKGTEELRRYFNDMAAAIKTKAEEEDLRSLEACLNAKIEELRLSSGRKYAEKAETSKSIKYLDAQLKHIIEVYIKKQDKGDNWLLAKKPIGGHMCASCEAYIGDLHDRKDDYVLWNKYPLREPQDKAYRIGNGFSRMLNMLNFETKGGNSERNEGSEEGQRLNSSNIGPLPTIKTKKIIPEEESNKNASEEEPNERSGSPSG